MTNEPKKPSAARSATITVGALAALGASLAFFEGGTYQTPYYDSIGVLTVCQGITGPEVIKGKRYSMQECKTLKDNYIAKMSAKLSGCLNGAGLTDNEWVAWGNFSYNVGAGAFCKSTAAKLIRAGNYYAACEQLPKWVYAGGRDCRVKGNNCGGIPVRREWERRTCHGEDLPVPRLK